ncbi:hypothetical protein LLEC1_04386 [Akanthomyces lecanii]|uniref:Uncharacterized protein n=1 Tax=Cordyceps confragosa TaxID=2714763 RepID=A0A179IEX2_CORDF|nr:hypothetical protein LLEC1_04386 [Akanthomyces lecanii]
MAGIILVCARDHPTTTTPLANNRLPAPSSSRNRGLFAFGFLAATATTVAFKYKSDAYRSNELLQQQRKAPNGYVSVDRSGGGI